MNRGVESAGAEKLSFCRGRNCDGCYSTGDSRTRAWDQTVPIGIGFDNGTNRSEALGEQAGVLPECDQINSGECALDIRR
jgi:hypothetical protein